MAISLFEYNETAYNSAILMMNKEGKAAIIHPTGTGKSFIGFKLCEDNPNKIICWLSPSEYIFETQLENLSAVSNGYQPKNIVFYTYARLMNLTDGEISKINPDYIVFDEFHRAGAQEWGKGVQRLLKYYANKPILGLSATSVRYLDNQRDMAEELFDGNIASYMTLGEAITRGILNAPIKSKNGNYIVFCSNYEHLCEVIDKVPEWFGKIDEKPHIYKVYSEEPSTDEAFVEFKNDNSEHLKLLFCIDMLNEGVHVDDINGVVFTVSPIIYKQQSGRALSANKKTTPVIFDIVLNIENLYSISSIEEEMQVATAYYKNRGEIDKILIENFHVYDEVKECRLLFNRLNDALSATWEHTYSIAERYYRKYGNLEVEKVILPKKVIRLGIG